ncbi:hypothetical protein KIW84_012769 [Lathyrus oleraceus]|uniref:Uncharacterized protein n=1 Tax=Pisum sativum TaxID=3888 RepID=A0A9D5BIT7_PEA|nr:hypothetical protein KIW84_012769 [Pisum sativum]
MFKTSEHPYAIRFTAGTRVSDINKHVIPGKKLNFKPFAEIIYGNWRSDLLVDGPKGKCVAEVEDTVVDDQVNLKGLMQGCKEGEVKNLKGKQVDFGEEGGKGKSVDGNIGRTTTDAAPSHISISSASDSSDENKTGDKSSDEDLSNRPRFVVWKKENKDGKVVQRNVLIGHKVNDDGVKSMQEVLSWLSNDKFGLCKL